MKKSILIMLYILASLNIFAQDFTPDNDWSKKDYGNFVVYTKKDSGKVPVLCFHKIGTEPRYEITSKEFEKFLIYLNENKFYPLSDKEFIDKDFSMVPTGFTPIVLGADDADKGNFTYKVKAGEEVKVESPLEYENGYVLDEDSMVYLLNKYLEPSNGRRNFTFYVAFNGVPFRQTNGVKATGNYYRGIPVVQEKFNYLLDNYIVGIHTVTHPVTKETSVEDFKWELTEFYNIMFSYVGDRVSEINTLAFPYGCADLDPKLREMVSTFTYKGAKIVGSFDFDGYFSQSPLYNWVDPYEVSRLGVDNQNIELVYGFLESVRLFNTQRVIVSNTIDNLEDFKYNSNDRIIIK